MSEAEYNPKNPFNKVFMDNKAKYWCEKGKNFKGFFIKKEDLLLLKVVVREYICISDFFSDRKLPLSKERLLLKKLENKEVQG